MHGTAFCQFSLFGLSLSGVLAVHHSTEEGDDSSLLNAKSLPSKLVQCSTLSLTRLLALAGHIALKQLVHLEHSLLNELKRRRLQKESEEEEKKRSENTSGSSSLTPRVSFGYGKQGMEVGLFMCCWLYFHMAMTVDMSTDTSYLALVQI